LAALCRVQHRDLLYSAVQAFVAMRLRVVGPCSGLQGDASADSAARKVCFLQHRLTSPLSALALALALALHRTTHARALVSLARLSLPPSKDRPNLNQQASANPKSSASLCDGASTNKDTRSARPGSIAVAFPRPVTASGFILSICAKSRLISSTETQGFRSSPPKKRSTQTSARASRPRSPSPSPSPRSSVAMAHARL
jgi:hypothetical protein